MTPRAAGYAIEVPRALLRLEGLLVLMVSTVAYAKMDAGWSLFAILFLVPDFSMAGYLVGPRFGAGVYNSAHSYILPLALLGASLAFAMPRAIAIGLIWVAHIGFDRAMGYGLKYTTGFGWSHLGPIGQASAHQRVSVSGEPLQH